MEENSKSLDGVETDAYLTLLEGKPTFFDYFSDDIRVHLNSSNNFLEILRLIKQSTRLRMRTSETLFAEFIIPFSWTELSSRCHFSANPRTLFVVFRSSSIRNANPRRRQRGNSIRIQQRRTGCDVTMMGRIWHQKRHLNLEYLHLHLQHSKENFLSYEGASAS